MSEYYESKSSLPGRKWNAETAYDLNLVAELKHGKLPRLEAELEALENIERKDDAILKEEVTAEEIAEIVSKWTGVPVTKLIEGEREKLLRLQSILHERVIGQNEAVEAGEDFTGSCGH